jgi:NAD(P)-dependent dehydrogenase (short-subunit alcohol dehydrogenase family)
MAQTIFIAGSSTGLGRATALLYGEVLGLGSLSEYSARPRPRQISLQARRRRRGWVYSQ